MCEKIVCERVVWTKLCAIKLHVRERCERLCVTKLCVTKSWMSPSATPATPNEGRCRQEPRLPRKVQVDVAKCRACHARCRGARATSSAPPDAAQRHKRHTCHAKRSWMPPSATLPTQMQCRCRQAPHLPRKMPRRPARPICFKRATMP